MKEGNMVRVAFLGLLCAASLPAAELSLENSAVRAVVSPENGGRLVRFTDLRSNRELIDAKLGACAEILPGEKFPGLLRNTCFRVVRSGAMEVVLAAELNDPKNGFELSLEKSYVLTGASVCIMFSIRNRGKDSPVFLRIQNAVSRKDQIYTFPIPGGIQAIYPDADGKAEPEMVPVRGWGALVSPGDKAGLLARFGLEEIRSLYHFPGEKLLTLEWYYRPRTLKNGECWQIRYELTALSGSFPVVMADGENILGLMPPRLKTGFNYELSAVRLDGGECKVTARGLAGKSVYSAEGKYSGSGVLTLPWTNITVERIQLGMNGSAVTLERTVYNEDVKRPPLPDLSGYSIPPFFPYCDYGNARPDTAGFIPPETDSFRRVYEQMRRSYINTVTTGDLLFPPRRQDEFEKNGTLFSAETAMECGLKMIPKMETLHARKKGDVFTGEADVKKDFERRGYRINVMRKIFEKYRDVILLHDLSDEPLPEWLGDYAQVQEFFRRNVDPVRPASPIFNLVTTQYLPYVPLYYGDQYAAHHGGSDPYLGPKIRTVVERAGDKPVWIMLQAFGNMDGDGFDWRLPDEAEMRHMIYTSVAHGAKGISFHSNPMGPRWLKGASYSDPAADLRGFETPTWRAIAEAGRLLTPVGPLLVTAQFKDSVPLESAYIGDAQSAYSGPAVTLGILELKKERGNLLAAVNWDLKNSREARLRLNPRNLPDKILVDLFSPDFKSCDGIVDLPFTLRPGEGRIWYFGSRAGAKQVINATALERARNEADILKIEEKHARMNRVDTSRTVALFQQASASATQGNGLETLKTVTSAGIALKEDIAATPKYAAVLSGLKAVHKALESVNELFRTHPQKFFTPDLKLKHGEIRRNVTKSAANSLILDMDRLSTRLVQLSDAVNFKGTAGSNGPEIKEMRKQSERLLEEAVRIAGKP